MKLIRFLIIVLIFSFILSGAAYCQWKDFFGFDSKTVPKPPSAKEVRTDEMKVMGVGFPVTIYSSKESFAEISRFYKQKLTSSGWSDLFAEKSSLKGAESLASSLASVKMMLIFLKDEEMIIIQKLPAPGGSTDTHFFATRCQNSFTEAEQVKKPPPKDLPIYPNAKEVGGYRVEYLGSGPLGYTTADSVESVLDFYRVSMPTHSWVLEKDMPIQESQTSAQDFQAIPNYNQLVPQEAIQYQQNFSAKIGALRFKKDNKMCTISATEMPSGKPGINMTIITIDYK